MKKIFSAVLISSITVVVANAKPNFDHHDKKFYDKPIKNDIGFYKHKIKNNDRKIQKLWEQIQALEDKNYNYFKKIERIRKRNSHHMSNLYNFR